MAERTNEMARREIEDLWWLLHSLEGLIDGRRDGDQIRVGLLRSVLTTTKPETSTTDPRVTTPSEQTTRLIATGSDDAEEPTA